MISVILFSQNMTDGLTSNKIATNSSEVERRDGKHETFQGTVLDATKMKILGVLCAYMQINEAYFQAPFEFLIGCC